MGIGCRPASNVGPAHEIAIPTPQRSIHCFVPETIRLSGGWSRGVWRSRAFYPDSAACFSSCLRRVFSLRITLDEALTMRVDSSSGASPQPRQTLTISKWVNEPYPPLNELLNAYEVVRLTRRPRWVLMGLCFIGRFPKKLKFRGRGIGWRRSEVLDWMSRDLAIARTNERGPRTCARQHPHSGVSSLRMRDIVCGAHGCCTSSRGEMQASHTAGITCRQTMNAKVLSAETPSEQLESTRHAITS